MDKLTKTASKLHTVFSIAEKVLMALAIAAIVCAGLIGVGFLLGLDPDTVAIGYEKIDIGYLELQIADRFGPDKWVILLQATAALVLCSICCFVARRIVLSITSILDPVSQGQPFHETISPSLRSIAIHTIILGIAYNCIAISELLLYTFAYDLPNLLISEKIAHISINYTIDISFLIVSGILLLLSYIFRYGAQLQQLSDETL